MRGWRVRRRPTCLAHRLDTELPTILYGSYATDGGKEHIGRVGMALEF